MGLGGGWRVLLVPAAVVGMLAAGTVLGTVPALAKGQHAGPPHAWRCPVGGDPYCPAGHLTMVGTGLDRPVTVAGRDFWTVLYLTGAGYRPYGYAEPSQPSPSGLGPRYRATYTVEPEHGPTLSMTQDLYPYAPSMAWAFTSNGQRFRSDMGAFTTPGGWWHSAALLEVLTAHGLPATAPAGASGTARAAGALAGPGSNDGAGSDGPGSPAGSPGGPGRIWIGVAALAVLLLVAALAGRPRRIAAEARR
ncbi:MAG: hypothetical protein M3Q23_01890 [Actinomycetota bacterium]|nr:hypothetical protein [Actinomycetota bacterium]